MKPVVIVNVFCFHILLHPLILTLSYGSSWFDPPCLFAYAASIVDEHGLNEYGTCAPVRGWWCMKLQNCTPWFTITRIILHFIRYIVPKQSVVLNVIPNGSKTREVRILSIISFCLLEGPLLGLARCGSWGYTGCELETGTGRRDLTTLLWNPSARGEAFGSLIRKTTNFELKNSALTNLHNPSDMDMKMR